jgi:hypothetical protein
LVQHVAGPLGQGLQLIRGHLARTGDNPLNEISWHESTPFWVWEISCFLRLPISKSSSRNRPWLPVFSVKLCD